MGNILGERKQRVEQFNRLNQAIGRNYGLAEGIYFSRENSTLCPAPTDKPQKENFEDIKLTMQDESTIEAAIRISRENEGKRIAILRFSSQVIGRYHGVIKGDNSQEDSIFRTSTLHQVLANSDIQSNFYKMNQKRNEEAGNFHGLDACIYTPDITILTHDDGQFLSNPEVVDVISCAAPNLRKEKMETTELYKLLIGRYRTILNAAKENWADIVILGAIGCGSYNNPADTASSSWSWVIPEYYRYFEHIHFAIPKGKTKLSISNFDTFAENLLGVELV